METLPRRRKRTIEIVKILRKTYPDVRLALDFRTPLELLIALILAAQCTDERVNRTTPPLFKKYRTAKAWAEADTAVLEEEIRSTGFFRQKAKAIQASTREIVTRFGGKVPESLEDLLSLPGVGRKTANILRGNAFAQPAIGVDTHVGRLAGRLGLSGHTDPDKIERDLSEVVPPADQVQFCSLIQMHGRLVCNARKPKCPECVLAESCPRVGVEA